MKILKILGILIGFFSFFSFLDPYKWFFHLPVVFALGCIVYGIGDIIESIKIIDKQ